MIPSDEEQIGRGDSFGGWLHSGPPLLLVAALGLGMWALSWNHGRPDAVGLVFALSVLSVGGGTIVYEFVHYRSLLKAVWLGEHGLRVVDRRDEVFVPYAAIDTVTQKLHSRTLYVVVRLNRDSPFGRRFTSLPIRSSFWNDCRTAFGGTDAQVAKLRERVEAARLGINKPLASLSPTVRSVVADEELDGPL